MRLEQQLLYEPRFQERQRVYTIVDLEYLSASALYGISGPLGESGPLRPIKKTEYLPLFDDGKFIVGETHHSKGLGKLKVYDQEKGIEYGVPIEDIINKPLKDWRIDKK